MANHSPKPDNYIGKKTWSEVMDGADASIPTEDQKQADASKRASNKGAAAKNGGGDK